MMNSDHFFESTHSGIGRARATGPTPCRTGRVPCRQNAWRMPKS
jgi:hypothetical protein